MGAADQPALRVPRMAVGEVRRLAKDRDAAVLRPAQDPIVRQIADQELVGVGEPDRPLEPSSIPGRASGAEHLIERSA